VTDMGMRTVQDPQSAASPALTPWGILLSYVRPHARILTGGAILSLLGSAAGLAQPLAAKMVIDTLSKQGHSSCRC